MKKFFLSFVFLCLAGWAGAQVSVTARVDKTNLTLDDELTLTVEVNGASGNMVMPQLPSMPAFNVYSREVQRLLYALSVAVNTDGNGIGLIRFAVVGELDGADGGVAHKARQHNIAEDGSRFPVNGGALHFARIDVKRRQAGQLGHDHIARRAVYFYRQRQFIVQRQVGFVHPRRDGHLRLGPYGQGK